jgi:beta-lactamase superfamily II metal-dependent hydrolase
MATDYVSKNKAKFFKTDPRTGELKPAGDLIWGDGVERLAEPPRDGFVHVKARGRTCWVRDADLGGESLLEFYFIDVGQGDGVLIRTPDGRHLLVDGGYLRTRQPTGKSAADFVDWKFRHDYGAEKIALDAMIASHCDADHYGGLWDLVRGDAHEELECSTVEIGTFFHAGVGWWKKEGRRSLGETSENCLTTLLGSGANMTEALAESGDHEPQGEWGQFLEAISAAGCSVRRLSHLDEWLPGYGPDAGSEVKIRILGPIEFEVGGRPARKDLGSDSQNTNGHSVLLRLDYGHARVLLTGDLNAGAQAVLMDHYRSRPGELACDVAKACHHGSDDCSLSFLQMLNAGATIISSGDVEAHAHPRPSIVAASALTGHLVVERDKVQTPLVYSTEIARSVRVGQPVGLAETRGGEPRAISAQSEYQPHVHFSETGAGDLRPKKGDKPLSRLRVIPGVVYGLVNIRTDGQKILCATMNEKAATFDVKTFTARF